MNIFDLKRKALGYRPMNDGDGSEGGSAAGKAARDGGGFGGTGSGIGGDKSYGGGMSGGFSRTPSYAGYTTGSTQNATAPAAVDAARESYSSDKADDGSRTITSLAKQAQETDTKLSDLLGREPDKTEARALAKAGFGDMTGINPNNESQSVSEFNASLNTQAVLNAVMPTLARMAVPGMSSAMGLVSMAQSIAKAVDSGDSPGDIAKTVVSGLVSQTPGAKSLGVGSESIGAALSGNIGDAVALGVANKVSGSLIGSAVSGLSDASGMTKSDVASGLALTGITNDVRSAVRSGALGLSNAVSGGFSSSPSFDGFTSRSSDSDAPSMGDVQKPAVQETKPAETKSEEADKEDKPTQGEAPKGSLSITPQQDSKLMERTTGAAFNGKALREIDKAATEINSVMGRGF